MQRIRTTNLRRSWHALLFVGLALVCQPNTIRAQTPRIGPAGIDGALLLCGSYQVSPEMCETFVDLAGGARAKIVILTFEKARWGEPPLVALSAAAKKRGAAEPTVIDFSDAAKAFPEATGLWLHVDSVSALNSVMKDGILEKHCRALLKRGGVIASAAAGVRYVGVKDLAVNTPAYMSLLPDALLEPATKGQPSRLPKAAQRWKELVAYDIGSDAALLVKGRSIRVVGPGSIQIFLYPGGRPMRTITLRGQGEEDLTALRRSARDRLQGFPAKTPEPPTVEKGTLVIVGGGGSPEGMYKKFVEYAGGKEKAKIVIFPTAAPEPLPKREVLAEVFRKAGAKKATVLYGKTLAQVESKEFLDTLKEATGLWFDGGRQWRFVDAYENTKALPLMHDVLARGGVIGGTSAGATIQGDYLCRGGVFHNFDIRYEGYERGLGFLKGVAIDQHFSQRKRLTEMTQLMKVYPQYLGIGIDEATAIVVQGPIAEVIGRGKVHFYDAARKSEKGQPDYEALAVGGRYDLKARKIVSATK